jgi:prepilin-type N-terminal cleavage/methylation domain-containing protein
VIKKIRHLNKSARNGFTLLELMVAMFILTIAMSIAFQAFSGTMRAWKRGTEVIDGIKHGDFAMSQLASAINSTLYFHNARKSYAFTVEKDVGYGMSSDTISFVTVSKAFVPADSPYAEGPHRLKLYVDSSDYGESALFALVTPVMPTDDETLDEYDQEYGAEPYLVTRSVYGLEILFYDEEDEDWTEEWDEENSVPERIQLTLYVGSEDSGEEPIAFSRMIEIPVAASVKAKLKGPSSGSGSNTSQPDNQGGSPSGASGGTSGGAAGGNPVIINNNNVDQPR